MPKTNSLALLPLASLALLLALSCTPAVPSGGTTDVRTKAQQALDDALTLDMFDFKDGGGALTAVSGSFYAPLETKDKAFKLSWSSVSPFVTKIDPVSGQVFIRIPDPIPADTTATLTATATPVAARGTEATVDGNGAAKDFSFTVATPTSDAAMANLVAAAVTGNLLDFSGKDSATAVTAGFSLPLSGSYGTEITWTSTGTGVTIDSSGKVSVTTPATGSAASTATLTPTVKKKKGATATTSATSIEPTKQPDPITITIPPVTPLVAVTNDAAAIPEIVTAALSTATTSGSPAGITGNFTLPTAGDRGTTIAWTSTKTDILTIDPVTNICTVIAPAVDTVVALDAVVTKVDGTTPQTATGSVSVKVKGAANAASTELAAALASCMVKPASGEPLTALVSSFTVTPVASPLANGVSIAWSASPATALNFGSDGTASFVATGSDQAVTLTATVSKTGATSQTKAWTLTISKITDADILAASTVLGTSSLAFTSGETATTAKSSFSRSPLDGTIDGSVLVWTVEPAPTTNMMPVLSLYPKDMPVPGSTTQSTFNVGASQTIKDQVSWIKATVTKNGKSVSKTWNITIIARAATAYEKFTADKTALTVEAFTLSAVDRANLSAGNNGEKLLKAASEFKLPVSGEYGSSYKWELTASYSPVPATLNADGKTVNIQGGWSDQSMTLTAKIAAPGKNIADYSAINSTDFANKSFNITFAKDPDWERIMWCWFLLDPSDFIFKTGVTATNPTGKNVTRGNNSGTGSSSNVLTAYDDFVAPTGGSQLGSTSSSMGTLPTSVDISKVTLTYSVDKTTKLADKTHTSADYISVDTDGKTIHLTRPETTDVQAAVHVTFTSNSKVWTADLDTYSNLNVLVHHTWVSSGSELTMLPVPGGTFQMGSASAEAALSDMKSATPVHWVKVSPFLISETEITQRLYNDSLFAKNNAYVATPDSVTGYEPVRVNIFKAMEFCNELSARDGFDKVYTISQSTSTMTSDFTKSGYRLPTEAEFEFLARSDVASTNAAPGTVTTTDFPWGTPPGSAIDSAGYNTFVATVATYAWYAEPTSGHPTSTFLVKPVKTGRQPTAYGVYDLFGNAREWCSDYYAAYPTDAYTQSTPLVDPQGPTKQPIDSYQVTPFVVRGGGVSQNLNDTTSYQNPFGYLRFLGSGVRQSAGQKVYGGAYSNQNSNDIDIGFHMVRKAP